jgi:hypothetical protein
MFSLIILQYIAIISGSRPATEMSTDPYGFGTGSVLDPDPQTLTAYVGLCIIYLLSKQKYFLADSSQQFFLSTSE